MYFVFLTVPQQNLLPKLTEIVFEASFFAGRLVNILSLEINALLFLLFCRLSMDRLSFVSSLLLIVSVTATLGSVIKAKNPNGEVKEINKWTYVIAYDQAISCLS